MGFERKTKRRGKIPQDITLDVRNTRRGPRVFPKYVDDQVSSQHPVPRGSASASASGHASPNPTPSAPVVPPAATRPEVHPVPMDTADSTEYDSRYNDYTADIDEQSRKRKARDSQPLAVTPTDRHLSTVST